MNRQHVWRRLRYGLLACVVGLMVSLWATVPSSAFDVPDFQGDWGSTQLEPSGRRSPSFSLNQGERAWSAVPRSERDLGGSLQKPPSVKPSPPSPLNKEGEKGVSLIQVDVGTALDPMQHVRQSQEFYEQGRYTEALDALTPAIAQFAAQGMTLYHASALSNQSLIYQQLGQWELANDAIAQSFRVLESLPEETSGKVSVWAQAQLIEGRLYFSQGQTEAALEVWTQAGDRFAALGDRARRMDSQINQAQALQSLGFYQRATQTLLTVQQTLASDPDSSTQAVTLRILGDIFRSSGQLSDSKTALEDSLAIAQRLDQPTLVADAQLSLGNTLWAIAVEQRRLGEAALRQADRDAAFAAFQVSRQAAIALYESASASSDATTSLQAQLNHLNLRLNQQEWESAAALAQAIAPQLDAHPPSRTSVYNRIALAEYVMQFRREAPNTGDDLPDPATILAIALQQANTLQDTRAQSYAWGSLGTLYEQAQQWSEAQSLTERSLFLAQAINAQDIAYRWSWQLGRVLKQQGKQTEAIAAYQDAVSILDNLRGDLVAINRDIQFSFRDRVEPVYRELVELLLQDEHPNLEQISTARSVIERLQLAELDNFFRSACLTTRSVQIDQIDPKAAVIYPILLRDRLAVILSLPGQPLQEFATPVRRENVEAVVSSLIQTLRIPPDSRGHLPFAQQLYDWLVRPLEPVLAERKIETLVFVPDSVLQSIPMAALHDGSQYLIQRYAVALTPSLQLLETRPLDTGELSVLKAGLSEERGGFSALPGVEQELYQLQTLVPQGETLLNQEFTDDRFQAAIQDLAAPIVHLATHGQFSSQLEETFILTWDNTMDVGELSQILRTTSQDEDNPVELLVLSACQTAVGDRRAALGLAGMAVGAGARSTVASLWQVDDEATVALINAFYEQIAVEGVTKAAALRRAQERLIQNPLYRRPYFWSAFVLVGNWL